MTDTTWLSEKRPQGFISRFLPSAKADDLRLVDWAALGEAGVRLIAVDLDNTLASHGSVAPDDYAAAAIRAMREAHLDVSLYSNAAHARDKRFADALGITAIEGVSKPSPKALESELLRRRLSRTEVVVVGDQLITDVWSANRLGVASIWVKKRAAQELFTIRLKRLAERLMLTCWKKRFQRIPDAPRCDSFTKDQRIP